MLNNQLEKEVVLKLQSLLSEMEDLKELLESTIKNVLELTAVRKELAKLHDDVSTFVTQMKEAEIKLKSVSKEEYLKFMIPCSKRCNLLLLEYSRVKTSFDKTTRAVIEDVENLQSVSKEDAIKLQAPLGTLQQIITDSSTNNVLSSIEKNLTKLNQDFTKVKEYITKMAHTQFGKKPTEMNDGSVNKDPKTNITNSN